MYDQYYNLQSMPFRLTPDPKFLFHSRGHSKALAYLRYGLQQGEGFVVITGEVGAGKTTLVRALDSQLRMSNVVATELVTTNLDPEELLRMVASGFGLSNDDLSKTALLKVLKNFFSARAREGKRILLVIDECHNLSASSLEELRMLSNFQAGDRALLQTFLLGQGEFRDTLQAKGLEQFRQRVIAAHHLGPLGEDETRDYINHRLRVVGWKGVPHFSEDAYEMIHEHTGGIPRQINTLCDRLLLTAALDEMHEIEVGAVRDVIAEQQTEIPKKAESEQEPLKPRPNLDPQPQSSTPMAAVPLDLERRMQHLERKVDELESKMRRDQDRLQKLIMMAMLSGEDLDLSEVLQGLKKADKA